MTPPPTTIFIADDHPIFRQGLRQLLEREHGFSVVGDAGDGPTALAAIDRLRPKVAVLDVDMPGMDGLAVAGAVRAHRLPTAIICLTMHKDPRIVNAALNAGVMGYVIKDDAATEIVESVKSVLAGRHFVSAQLTSLLVARHAQAGAVAERTPGIEALTDTERAVLRLLAEFKTTKAIAAALAISPRTVDRHRSNMVEKLGLNGTHALTRFAVTHSSSL